MTPERQRVVTHVHVDSRPPGGAGRGIGGVALAVLVAMAAVSGYHRLVDLLPDLRNPFAAESVDRTQPAVLKALEDLHEYRAASGEYQVVVDLEEDARYLPAVVKGERTLFVGVGSVDAGVDFSGLGSDAVAVAPNREAVTITLPHARVATARVDPTRSHVADRRRGLLDRLGSVFADSPTGERELFVLTEQRLQAAAAASPELVERAEGNTRSMLEVLLGSLGFDDVTVRFV